MDIGSVRPVITGLTAPVPRAPAAADQATETDLPVRAAVTEASKSTGDGDTFQGSFSDGGRQATENFDLRSCVTIDQETRELIFQTVDPATGEVKNQLPEENKLRFRAMIEAWTGSGQSAAAVHGSTTA